MSASPDTPNRPPARRRNEDVRPREYLTPDEVKRLVKAAGATGRHGHRDAHLILICYRHGFRVSELVGLQRAQVDLAGGHLHVRRKKHGKPATHRILGDELRALRKIFRAYPESPYVFVSERGGPLSVRAAFKIIQRAGEQAGFAFPIHPHMLRHAAGFKLANDGRDVRAIQDFLGHRQIQHTVRYTELAPRRLRDIWEE